MKKTPLSLATAALIIAAGTTAAEDAPYISDGLPNPPSWTGELKKLGRHPKALDGSPLKTRFRGHCPCTIADPTPIDSIHVERPPIVVIPPQQLAYLHRMVVEETIISFCDRNAEPEPEEKVDDEANLRAEQIRTARRRILAAAGQL